MRIADGLARRIESDRFAADVAVEPHPADPAGQHPAQPNVARRDRLLAIDHEREVDELAIGGAVHLAQVQADEIFEIERACAWRYRPRRRRRRRSSRPPAACRRATRRDSAASGRRRCGRSLRSWRDRRRRRHGPWSGRRRPAGRPPSRRCRAARSRGRRRLLSSSRSPSRDRIVRSWAKVPVTRTLLPSGVRAMADGRSPQGTFGDDITGSDADQRHAIRRLVGRKQPLLVRRQDQIHRRAIGRGAAGRLAAEGASSSVRNRTHRTPSHIRPESITAILSDRGKQAA